MEKLIEILGNLDAKYHFTDEEVSVINEALYGDEDKENETLYGDEYAEEECED